MKYDWPGEITCSPHEICKITFTQMLGDEASFGSQRKDAGRMQSVPLTASW